MGDEPRSTNAHNDRTHTREVHPSSTHCEMTWIVMPSQANAIGTVFGGQIMAWIDVCAAVACQRFARSTVVTASMDNLIFRAAVKQGQVVVLRAAVNRAWNSSMEVGVRVEAEDPRTGYRAHTSTAYLTFVALDADGNKVKCPTLVPETDDEKRRYDDATRRRERRLQWREEDDAHERGQ